MGLELNILSGGAAAAVVKGIQHTFEQEMHCTIHGTFNAVGEMRDKLLSGEPCDVVILTESLIEQLIRSGHVLVGTNQSLGKVQTGIAVKQGEICPDVSTPERLALAFKTATAIYCPDTKKSTAGIHFMHIFKQLGLNQTLASKLREYGNGALAMQAMAQSHELGLIGCTQATEIHYTVGVVLAANLPKEFELATNYTLGVCAQSLQPELSKTLAQWLCGAQSESIRRAGGFEF